MRNSRIEYKVRSTGKINTLRHGSRLLYPMQSSLHRKSHVTSV